MTLYWSGILEPVHSDNIDGCSINTSPEERDEDCRRKDKEEVLNTNRELVCFILGRELEEDAERFKLFYKEDKEGSKLLVLEYSGCFQSLKIVSQ